MEFQDPPGDATLRRAKKLTTTGLVNEIDSKNLLAAFGIDVAVSSLTTSEDEAKSFIAKSGFPVAVKIASPGISHKSDIGCVFLNVPDEAGLVEAWRKTMANARAHAPGEELLGISVQPMVRMENSFELIAGMKKDPVFGPLLMVGSGGVTTELFHDVAFELLSINQRIAMELLQTLRVWPILRGFRGKPPMNIRRLTDVLMQLSDLVAEHPEIDTIEMNPLLVSPDGAIALDARLIVHSHAENPSR